MRTRTTAAALTVVLLAALAGCGDGDETATGPTPSDPPTTVPVPTVETPTAAPTEPAPTSTAPAAPPSAEPTATATPPTGSSTLTYFLIRELEATIEPVTVDYDPAEVQGAVAREAITRLLAAPDTPDGLVNLTPDGTELLGVDLDGTLLTVDLSAEVAEGQGGAGFESAYLQAIAHTGAQFPTVEAVQVLVEGEVVESLWGHADTTDPIVPDAFILSPIIVTTVEGEGGAIRLTGTASTFEATIDVVVTRDGTTVEEAFVTATCGTGCRGDWTYELADLEPGAYEVVLTEPDPSDGEGNPPFTRTVEVTVTA